MNYSKQLEFFTFLEAFDGFKKYVLCETIKTYIIWNIKIIDNTLPVKVSSFH